MNEDYLKQFRKQPNVSFVGKVHMRLERKERIQTIKSYIMRSALTLTLVFGSLMAFSFTVRAEVIGWRGEGDQGSPPRARRRRAGRTRGVLR